MNRIGTLIDQPVPRDGQPQLDFVERLLTDGYAGALELEAERWRLERRIAELAGSLASGDLSAKTQELSVLTKRLKTADAELAGLRGLLVELRERASELRAA